MSGGWRTGAVGLVLLVVVPLLGGCGEQAVSRPTVAGFRTLPVGPHTCPVAWLPGRPVKVSVERAGKAPADSVVAQLGGEMVTCVWRRGGARLRVSTIVTDQSGGATAALGALVMRERELPKARLDDYLNAVATAKAGRWTSLRSPGVHATRLRLAGSGEIVVAVVGPASNSLLAQIKDRAAWD